MAYEVISCEIEDTEILLEWFVGPNIKNHPGENGFSTTMNSVCEVPRESGWDEILDWTASMVRVWALSILRSGQLVWFSCRNNHWPTFWVWFQVWPFDRWRFSSINFHNCKCFVSQDLQNGDLDNPSIYVDLQFKSLFATSNLFHNNHGKLQPLRLHRFHIFSLLFKGKSQHSRRWTTRYCVCWYLRFVSIRRDGGCCNFSCFSKWSWFSTLYTAFC